MKSETIGYIEEIGNVIGMSMKASGGHSSIGDIILVYNEEQNRQMPAEMVGFKGGRVQLMTYETTGGIASSSFVRNTGRRPEVPVGDFLKGRIINTMGKPIDGRNIFRANQYHTANSPCTNPLDRPPTRDHLGFGIKAIDSLNTTGKEQRIGMFAGSGVGKNTLIGMVAKNVKTDINVIALVEERGREVLGFVQKDLGEEGMKRSALVVVTSDQPAMLRVKYPLVVTVVAEYFRGQGFDILLTMNSLTRYAMAQREIGLTIEGPLIARGYTPSICMEFPKLLERNGNSSQGSITGVCTVLVEGNDTNEPTTDTVRGILDGHIVLSRQLANENHFPTIDIGASISHLMIEIVDEEHHRISSRFHNMLSFYQRNSNLIPIDACEKRTNAVLDEAVSKINKMNAFL